MKINKMKNIFTNILLIIAGLLLWYVIFSFLNAEFNPFLWGFWFIFFAVISLGRNLDNLK